MQLVFWEAGQPITLAVHLPALQTAHKMEVHMETIFLSFMFFSLLVVFTIDTIQKRRRFLKEGKQE